MTYGGRRWRGCCTRVAICPVVLRGPMRHKASPRYWTFPTAKSRRPSSGTRQPLQSGYRPTTPCKDASQASCGRRCDLDGVPRGDWEYARDLGLVRSAAQGGLECAHPIYSEVVPQVLAGGLQPLCRKWGHPGSMRMALSTPPACWTRSSPFGASTDSRSCSRPLVMKWHRSSC